MSGSTEALRSDSSRADHRRLRVLYAGRDSIVHTLLEQLPFAVVERATCAPDGTCLLNDPESQEGGLLCDVIVVDEAPGLTPPLQIVRSVTAQAPALPIIVLVATGATDLATAALDLGADDIVIKTGVYRRRLLASLQRLHERLELTTHHRALRDREARLRQIVEALPVGIVAIGSNGKVLAINAAGLAEFGLGRPSDVLGRDFVGVADPNQRDDVQRQIDRIIDLGPGTIAFNLADGNGASHRIELRAVRLERDARGAPGVVAAIGVSSWDTAGEAWEAARVHFEGQIAELRSIADMQAEREIALDALRAEMRDVLAMHATQQDAWQAERDRRDHETAERSAPAAGHPVQLGLPAVDARLDRLLHCGLFGYGTLDLDGRILECNDAFAQMLGYADLDDARRRSAERPLSAIVARITIEAQSVRGRRTVRMDASLERADGEPIRVLEALTLIEDDARGGTVAEIVLVDLSPIARLEERLRQEQRLSDVGALAAIIAPELQTMSAAFGGPSGDAARHLALFARRQTRPLERIDLGDAIRRAEPILRQLMGPHGDLSVDIVDTAVLHVAGDDLDQLFTTLLVSSRDLLEHGGGVRLTITRATGDRHGHGAPAESPTAERAIVLSVRASGYGVGEPQRTAALEFVVRRCGGTIEIAGDPGRSATFDVRFSAERQA